MPIFTIPIHEHGDPTRPGPYPHGRGRGREITRVGITSARPDRTGRVVFQQMDEFAGRLKALSGVSGVMVKAGLGAWEGGSEPTWVVSYRGNGAATRLLAQTAKRYNQDAVLIMKGCKGANCSPAVELIFETGISGKVRDAVHKLLTENGLGGWTWYKRQGKTMLRAVAVPQWGGEATAHLASMAKVSRALAAAGLTHRTRQKKVAVSIMERDGVYSYDSVIEELNGRS